MEKPEKDFIRRVHTLPAVILNDKVYQQKVIEEIYQDNQKNVRVITIDEKGKVIAEEEVRDAIESNHYYSEVKVD